MACSGDLLTGQSLIYEPGLNSSMNFMPAAAGAGRERDNVAMVSRGTGTIRRL
jgi:hypothetical protein